MTVHKVFSTFATLKRKAEDNNDVPEFELVGKPEEGHRSKEG